MTQSRHPNRQQGRFAEKHVADRFDLEHTPDETNWFDAVNPRTGTKVEVKSTTDEIVGRDGTMVPGEFRLWRDQHRSLLASDTRGTAWYAFVLLDDDGHVLEVQRRRPSTVTDVIDEWVTGGHDERDGPQAKVPWPLVLDITLD